MHKAITDRGVKISLGQVYLIMNRLKTAPGYIAQARATVGLPPDAPMVPDTAMAINNRAPFATAVNENASRLNEVFEPAINVVKAGLQPGAEPNRTQVDLAKWAIDRVHPPSAGAAVQEPPKMVNKFEVVVKPRAVEISRESESGG